MTDTRLYSFAEILAAAREVRPTLGSSTAALWIKEWYINQGEPRVRGTRCRPYVHTAAAREALIARAARPLPGSDLPEPPSGWHTVRQIRRATGWNQAVFQRKVDGVPSGVYGCPDRNAIRPRTFYDTAAIPGYQDAVEACSARRAARQPQEPRARRRTTVPGDELKGTWVVVGGVRSFRPDP